MKSATDIVSTIKFGVCGVPYFDSYALDDQGNIDITQEECAELIQVLSKIKRYPDRDYRDRAKEELSHVLTSCARISQMLGVSSSDVLEEINKKRNKLLKEAGVL